MFSNCMRHTPVLVNEVVEALQLSSGKNVIDCTLGDAGHSERILELTAPHGKLLGIDADAEAILRAKHFLHRFGERTVYVRENFVELSRIVSEQSFGPVHGILMDFGWSTPQFEERKRGFSFQNSDEPLDMRYDTRDHLAKTTAYELLNTASYDELEEMFRVYGEERLSVEIAQAIVDRRVEHPLETVRNMVELVLEVYRKKLKTDKEIPWVGGLHPATKVFQAIRIAVNDELGVIERVLPQAFEVAAPGGIVAVITFHSLEDRIVKHFFKKHAGKKCTLITKKPIIASEEEARENPRARSAKLRVVSKIG
jgi:16S rRNA (cytosine1402-N4)-methyltransferase